MHLATPTRIFRDIHPHTPMHPRGRATIAPAYPYHPSSSSKRTSRRGPPTLSRYTHPCALQIHFGDLYVAPPMETELQLAYRRLRSGIPLSSRMIRVAGEALEASASVLAALDQPDSAPCVLTLAAAHASPTRAIRTLRLPPSDPPPSHHPHCPAPGVVFCLGGRLTQQGLHHVCLVSPAGDFVMDHLSMVGLKPFAHQQLTAPALATISSFHDLPPAPCCYARRPRRPPPLPSSTPRVPRPPPYSERRLLFPPFDVRLPPGIYRAPPLSTILAEPRPTDIVMEVRGVAAGSTSRKLVRSAYHPTGHGTLLALAPCRPWYSVGPGIPLALAPHWSWRPVGPGILLARHPAGPFGTVLALAPC